MLWLILGGGYVLAAALLVAWHAGESVIEHVVVSDLKDDPCDLYPACASPWKDATSHDDAA